MSEITLTDDQQNDLDELVHDVASQIASNAINADEGMDFLLSLGYAEHVAKDMLAGDEPDEVIHDAAAAEASDAINSGRGWDFLLTYGWTNEEIKTRLGL